MVRDRRVVLIPGSLFPRGLLHFGLDVFEIPAAHPDGKQCGESGGSDEKPEQKAQHQQ